MVRVNSSYWTFCPLSSLASCSSSLRDVISCCAWLLLSTTNQHRSPVESGIHEGSWGNVARRDTYDLFLLVVPLDLLFIDITYVLRLYHGKLKVDIFLIKFGLQGR